MNVEASDSVNRQVLRDQLNQRWFDTPVPSFLEERKNEEAAYAGDTLLAQESLDILHSDLQRPTVRISSLVDPKIYSSLQHQMKSKWLISVLKAGELAPRNGSFGNNSEEDSLPGIYLELHRFANPKPFAWGDVELHFDYGLLDRSDYLISPFWDYGAYGPLAASPIVSPGRVAFYITSYLQKGLQNEVVFMKPISLEKLVKIVVPTGKKKALLNKMRENHILCPQTNGCENLVTEQAKPN